MLVRFIRLKTNKKKGLKLILMEINSLKRGILFLNASGYKLAVTIANALGNGFSNKKTLGIAFNVGLELCIVYLLASSGPKASSWALALFFPFVVFYLGVDYIFSKELDLVSNNYNLYYKQWSFVIYCALITLSIIYGVCLLFLKY
jgi:hypothetical protein